MLSKKYRLTRNQVNLVYKKGKSRKWGILGVKFLDNRQTFPRFAVVVPQAVAKKAVQRNRLRRLTYEIIHQISKDKELPSRDYVVRYFRMPQEKMLKQLINRIFQDV